MKFHFSTPIRAVAAGVVCLAILTGMMIGHAWPLWTGETIVLPVDAHDDRNVFRGEFVHITTPANRVIVSDDPHARPPAGGIVVRPAQHWPRDLPTDRQHLRRRMQGRVVYVQFEPSPAEDGLVEHRPVSISTAIEDGKVNIRGHVRVGPEALFVDFGLDAFYMQQGRAREVEEALRQGRRVQMQVAVTSSGRARIRHLLIDGKEVVQ